MMDDVTLRTLTEMAMTPELTEKALMVAWAMGRVAGVMEATKGMTLSEVCSDALKTEIMAPRG